MTEQNITYRQNGLTNPNTKCVFSFLILTGLLVATLQPVLAQEEPGSLIKAGYLPYRFSNYYGDQYLLHLEYERSFRKAGYLSQGIGYDYIHYSQNQRHNILRYNLRFYPFFWLSVKRPYKGLYLGVSPVFQWRKYSNVETMYGFGIIPTLGYQFMIKDKISLAFDMNMVAYRNLNENAPHSTGDKFYYDYYFSLKVGLKIGGRKKRKK